MALSSTARTNIINDLVAKGYSANSVSQATDEELLGFANYENQAEADYRKSENNRANTNDDFRGQLAQLTSSKQRQAEQAGRISQNVARTQGLSQMMSNF
jgi:hypothetical protein